MAWVSNGMLAVGRPSIALPSVWDPGTSERQRISQSHFNLPRWGGIRTPDATTGIGHTSATNHDICALIRSVPTANDDASHCTQGPLLPAPSLPLLTQLPGSLLKTL